MSDYEERIARVKSTYLGAEDHGIFTAMLRVDYGGSGQGIGGYGFDEWDEANKRRVGVAFGMEWIKRVVEACGVRSWEEVTGRTVFVLFDKDAAGSFSRPVGIAPLPTEKGERVIFEDLRREFYPESVAS